MGCRGQVEVSNLLQNIEANTWTEISIDTRCFTAQGVKFENMVAPFQFTSKDALTISISDIAFVFDAEAEADILCAE